MSGWFNSRAENRPVPSDTQALGVKAALTILRNYKLYASPWFAGSCRFEPTCSVYAYQAIERFGVRRGMWMGLKRLLRCHPLSRKFGYDPVPDSLQAATSQALNPQQETSAAGVVCKGAHS